MSRRKGRILAFQALYSYDVGGVPLNDLLTLNWANSTKTDADMNTESADFARLIIAGTIEHIDEIDNRIKTHLTAKWDLSRINKVSLAVLRISVFSLLFQPEVSAGIVIDEAIDIVKEYGSDDAFKFINAVLDSISKELASDSKA